MSQIQIVTDSSAEVSPSTMAELDIKVLPVTLGLGGQTWRDGVDITSLGFLEQVASSQSLPIAVPPSVEAFQQAYDQAGREGRDVMSLHMSSKLSNAASNARQASNAVLGRNEVVVLDSEMATVGLGMLVEAAARAAAEGQSLQQIVRLVRGMMPHVYIVYFIESLEYLERSKLIDKSQSVLGNLLAIKPMIIIEDGEIMPLEKVRTREQAVDRLHEFIGEFIGFEKLVISHGLNDRESPVLLERIAETFPNNEISIRTFGATMATHVGPNALGVIVYEGD
jgi:DegV family protein with EDD domain